MYEEGQTATVPEFSGRAIFCEDIRNEASGQLTLVGCINGSIHTADFPATLPKLCVLVELQLRYDTEDLPVQLRGYLPGAASDNPYVEVSFDFEEGLKDGEMPTPDLRGPYPGLPVKRVQQAVVSVGLEVKQPGPIQIRAFRNGEVLAVGALLVERSPG